MESEHAKLDHCPLCRSDELATSFVGKIVCLGCSSVFTQDAIDALAEYEDDGDGETPATSPLEALDLL